MLSVTSNRHLEGPIGLNKDLRIRQKNDDELNIKIIEILFRNNFFKGKQNDCRTTNWEEIFRRDGIDSSKIKPELRKSFYIEPQKTRFELIKEALEVANRIDSLYDKAFTRIIVGKALMKIDQEAANQCFETLESLNEKWRVSEGFDCYQIEDILRSLVQAIAPVNPQKANAMALKISDSDQKKIVLIDILILSPIQAIDVNQDEGIIFSDKGLQYKSATNLLRAYKETCQLSNEVEKLKFLIVIGKALTPSNPDTASQCFNNALNLMEAKPIYKILLTDLLIAMTKLDSEKVYSIGSKDHDKFHLIISNIAMGSALVRSDPEIAETHFKKAFENLEKFNDSRKLKAFSMLIEAKASIINPQEAQKIAEQIHSYLEAPHCIASAFIHLGKVLKQRNPSTAGEYFIEAYKKLSEIEDDWNKVEILAELFQHFINHG